MATGNVIMIDEDGNIGSSSVSENSEQISGLLFDISQQTDFWTTGKGVELAAKLQDTVIELNSLQDAIDLGLNEVASGEGGTKLLQGIPYYHIKHFFNLTESYEKTLYIMFADCSSNWDAIISMQKAANGQIGQFGVWTEQKLWKQVSEEASEYKVMIVDELQTVANNLAKVYNAPACIVLNANSAELDGTTTNSSQITLSKIPTCYVDARYVTVSLGQEATDDVHSMQAALTSKTPVGNVGLALGLLNRSNVAYSIGYVNDCNLRNVISTEIEFGFGDSSLGTEGLITNPTPYSALSMSQLDTLDDKGYIFLHKYAGYAGVFFSKDYSCSDGDYNSISRNRVINKSRRMVRRALLPYVNAPIYLSSGGTLSTGDRTNFINIITDVLTTMLNAGEISAIGSVTFDSTTNLLQTKTLLFSYKVLPVGCAEMIQVTEGFTVTV